MLFGGATLLIPDVSINLPMNRDPELVLTFLENVVIIFTRFILL